MKKLLLSTMLMVFFAGIVLAQTPIAHWPLNGDANDAIGSKNGVQSGGVSWVNDSERGECVQLDGTDGIITLPAVLWDSETDTNATITCWFNWAGGADWQRVYSLGMTEGAWGCMYFCVKDNAQSLHVTFKPSDSETWYDYTSTSFADFDTVLHDTWYFSAIVLKEDSLKIWIDNNKILEQGSVPVTPQKIQPDISQNVLGKSHWADATFKGMIDDFRIYGEALTDAQVIDVYNGSGTGIIENNTSLAIRFYGKDGRIFYNTVDDSKISNVAVYNLSGSLMFRANRISDLKTRQFNPGIYLVSVTNGKEQITRKVTIIK